MKDLRSFLNELSFHDEEYAVADGLINPKFEITRCIYKLIKENKNRAVKFDNVSGSRIPVVSNLFGTRERLALALGCLADRLHQTYREREAAPLQPKIVESGEIQELIYQGEDVDLGLLPVVSHNANDAGPYITAGMMTVKDPDTGIRNTGIYRLMIKDRNHTGIHLAETSNAYYIYRKYIDRKLDMPVAITIGTHPALYLGCLSLAPLGVDEYAIMGALQEAPVELVRCGAVDLEVPANGEICLEGNISWVDRQPEGPVGEFHTLYSEQHSYPVVTLKRMTMKKNPIYLDICSGSIEHLLLGGLPRLGKIYASVKQACPGVKDVYMPPSGFCRAMCFVSIKKRVEGEPANAAFAVFATDAFVRHVVVVDEDIDIFNEGEVLKAINLNTDISKCFVVPYAKGSPIDPMSKDGLVSKIGIDATEPIGKHRDKINYAEGLDDVDLLKIFTKLK